MPLTPTSSGRPNTGDKLRSGARVLSRRRGHEAALYESHASLPCNGAAESFVSFIPLFDGALMASPSADPSATATTRSPQFGLAQVGARQLWVEPVLPRS